jgi:hypothetical protein
LLVLSDAPMMAMERGWRNGFRLSIDIDVCLGMRHAARTGGGQQIAG